MKKFTHLSIIILILGVVDMASAATSKIGILVFDGFLTSDATAPIEVFGAASKKAWFSRYEVVTIAATRKKTVKSEEGLTIIADFSIYDEIELDALIAVSAYDMRAVLNNNDLISYVRRQSKTSTWMASNCSGASILGAAGILDGKRVTTWAGGEKTLQNKYPKANVQFDQNVVVDEGLITSNGGPVSYQGAFELLTQLSSKAYSDKIAEDIGFTRLSKAFK
ncbi:MAG: transcriptional regulator GlxA family with amidase domain [Flavobacteriales bacterium]|jgi:transcriptional regulator GlxA family with amidase domain